jgi:hypothetical protein
LVGGTQQPSNGDILITGSFADVSVQGGDTGIGGLVGLVWVDGHQATVEASYAIGDVNGSDQVGGLIGLVAGVTIKDSYALGDVIGVDKEVGGLIGFAFEGSIINAYSAGRVQGARDVGGLVGSSVGGTIVTESFWDVESSGFGAAADDNFGATGKTTSDMTSFATFDAAWNSPTETVIVDGWQAPNNPSWGICESVNEGYPFLLWQFKSNPCVSDPDPALSIQVVPRPAALRVSWLAPLNDGGSPITRYVARANPSCEVPALANEIPGETLYSCDITGLDPEQTYQVFVTAFTDAGSSEAAALGNDNGGNNGASTPASFAPNPIIVVPVNNPWALLVLMMLMLMLGLTTVLNWRHQ